jgi:3-hydroxyisobutyrate dehydrogenase
MSGPFATPSRSWIFAVWEHFAKVSGLQLGVELAHELEVPMNYAEVVFKDFSEALDRGWGDRDSRSPMQLQNERAGVTIKVSAEDVQKRLARA